MQCDNNLKQLVLACHTYESLNRGLPLLYSSSSQLGWITQILPYFEQDNLYRQYNLKQPWFDASNAAVVNQRISVIGMSFQSGPAPLHGHQSRFCGPKPEPADHVHGCQHRLLRHFRRVVVHNAEGAEHDSRPAISTFTPTPPPATDLSGVFGAQSSTSACRKLADVTDGLSNTVMIGEMSGRPWLYLAGGQRISVANFPSYVSDQFGGRCKQISL